MSPELSSGSPPAQTALSSSDVYMVEFTVQGVTVCVSASECTHVYVGTLCVCLHVYE